MLHESLGVSFVRLDTGALFRRAKAENSRSPHVVAQAIGKGNLRAYHHQARAVFPREVHQGCVVLSRDIHALPAVGFDTRIARRDVKPLAQWRLHEFPRQGMFPSPAAYQ